MTPLRLLFVSGSIGLGHAGRDLAIARALRSLDPDIEFDWLAGEPARRLIAEAGETLLPQSEMLDETGPDRLADMIARRLGRQADWPAIRADGARRAARLIVALTEESNTRRAHANARASERHQPSHLRTALPSQPARRGGPWRDRAPAPRARRPGGLRR